MDPRARLTIPDVLFILLSVGVLGALYPVFFDLLEQNVDSMGTASEWLWQLFLPLAILVLLSVLWVKTTRGVA